MKPFLFLGTRAEDAAADGEYEAMLRCTGLDEGSFRRHRLERDSLGGVDLSAWSGVVLGGGPFNVSDPEATKAPVQLRAEAELTALLDRVVARDFPFLGCCYGIGALGNRDGGLVDRTFGEPIGAVRVALTDAGRADPLFSALPESFDAFLGHKEGVTTLPRSGVTLASSASCPVQGFRLGRSVYATQFHPELDVEGLCTRIDVYRSYGYFPPAEADTLKASARQASVTEPARLLARFVGLFGADWDRAAPSAG